MDRNDRSDIVTSLNAELLHRITRKHHQTNRFALTHGEAAPAGGKNLSRWPLNLGM